MKISNLIKGLQYLYYRRLVKTASLRISKSAYHKFAFNLQTHRLFRARLRNLVVWGRGVDTAQFSPRRRGPSGRPRLLYVGRVAIEKNLEAFLELNCDATKVIVGDGPARATLQARYPHVEWAGYRYGTALAKYYADADVFVFPSRTDTFGLVMLEAMACGTPVAAYPVTGPVDVVVDGVNGALDADLGRAVRRALTVDRQRCRAFALERSWASVADRLAAHLTVIDWRDPTRIGPTLLPTDRSANHVDAARSSVSMP